MTYIGDVIDQSKTEATAGTVRCVCESSYGHVRVAGLLGRGLHTRGSTRGMQAAGGQRHIIARAEPFQGVDAGGNFDAAQVWHGLGGGRQDLRAVAADCARATVLGNCPPARCDMMFLGSTQIIVLRWLTGMPSGAEHRVGIPNDTISLVPLVRALSA